MEHLCLAGQSVGRALKLIEPKTKPQPPKISSEPIDALDYSSLDPFWSWRHYLTVDSILKPRIVSQSEKARPRGDQGRLTHCKEVAGLVTNPSVRR